MKSIFLIFTFITAFSQITLANISENSNPLFSEISAFDIGHEELSAVVNGHISLDLDNQTIEVTLIEDTHCNTNQFCIALAPKTHLINFPIVAVESDWCGTHTYRAELESSQNEGVREILEITDYSKINCRIHVPFQTEAVYKTLNPETNRWTESSFGAGQFFILNKISKNLQSQM